jgi:hypothetical protein
MIGGFDLFYPVKELYKSSNNTYRNNFCNGKSRPLFNGELHPLCANFEGPGTRIDLDSVKNTEPFNGVDSCAKTHDIYYLDSQFINDKDAKERFIRQADNEFKHCAESYKSDGIYYTLSKGIGVKNAIEDSPIGKHIIPTNYYGKKY